MSGFPPHVAQWIEDRTLEILSSIALYEGKVQTPRSDADRKWMPGIALPIAADKAEESQGSRQVVFRGMFRSCRGEGRSANRDRTNNGSEPSALSRKFCLTVRVMAMLMQLRQDGLRMSIRELFYTQSTVFRTQREMVSILQEICASAGVPRHSLGLSVSGKGLASGCFCVAQSLDWKGNDGTAAFQTDPMQIPGFEEEISAMHIENRGARCILVIEKEAVFRSLVARHFPTSIFPCILVTGCGFPDHPTRFFVRHCRRSLRLPAFGLFDCNPFGIRILETYRGSSRTSKPSQLRALRPEDAHFFRRGPARGQDVFEVAWLGIRFSQALRSNMVPEALRIPLSAHDRRHLDSMIGQLRACRDDWQHPFDGEMVELLQETQLMAAHGWKCEIEALASFRDPRLLDDFVARELAFRLPEFRRAGGPCFLDRHSLGPHRAPLE